MKTTLNKTIGRRIKLARENAGLTQEDLAGKTERTKEAISNIERGVNLPSLETLHRICYETNVSIGMMLEEADRPSSYLDVKFQVDLKILELSEPELKLLLSVLEAFAKHRSNT